MKRVLPLLTLLACSPAPKGPTPDTGSSPTHTGDSGPGPDSADSAETEDTAPDPCAGVSWPEVVLNEWVAANLESWTSAEGETPDWIELVSRAGADVELEGWSLVNAEGERWTFAPLTLPSDTPLMLLADEGDAQGDPWAGEQIHLSFKLPAEDAGLSLLAPDGCIVDAAAPERLYGDVSYGRAGDDPSALEYFLEPTPGAENITESRPGFAQRPRLDPDPGFVSGPVTVSVSSDEDGAALYVTTDGGAPDEASTLYTGPFDVETSTQPAVVRAVSVVEGLWPSRIASSTYIGDPELAASGMLVVSLIADPEDLFSDETGIYAFGLDDYEHSYPYFGANFWEEWERDVAVQVWDEAGELVLDQDAGISIHGGYTRAFDQKSLRLSARSAYGPDDFDHAFFGEHGQQDPSTLVLQIGMDWCSTHLQEVTLPELLRDPSTGALPESVDTAGWAPAQVWINGEYWGYYNLRERVDGEWMGEIRDVDPDALDRVELGWTSSPHWELEQGTWDNFYALNDFVDAADMSDPDTWTEFDGMVDLDSLASAVVAEAWIGNTDWWYNNLRLWRPTAEGGQWRWVIYDFGHGWPSVDYNQVSTSVGWTGDGLPISSALRNPSFRALLANDFSDLLNTRLEGEAAAERFDAMVDRVEPAMEAQMDRWCSGGMGAWRGSTAVARAFVRAREDIVRDQVEAALGLTGQVEVDLDADPVEGGSFRLTAVSVDPPFTGVFYEGVPVTITAEPAEGYRFVGWSDSSLGTSPTIEVELDGDAGFTAMFEVE